jgi:5'-3' exonuclease
MTTALIDGDVVAYMACESRYRNGNGVTIVSLEQPVFTPDQDQQYLNNAWLKFQEIVIELGECCFTDKYKMAVKGEGNFRNDMYPEYKANRHADPSKRNPFVPLLRKMAVEAGMAIAADGQEADDLLRIWQQECVMQGEDYVICSIDKDLRCMPGRHYLMHKNEFLTVTEMEATRFYYEQLLQGDPTDNIKGIPKIGPKKAKAYLADFNTEPMFQYTVTEAYQSYFGNTWEEELIFNGKLIYLKKTMNDEFSLVGWNVCPYTPYVPAPEISEDFLKEPPTENVVKKVTPWEQLLGHDNLTPQLEIANDKLEIELGLKPRPVEPPLMFDFLKEKIAKEAEINPKTGKPKFSLG